MIRKIWLLIAAAVLLVAACHSGGIDRFQRVVAEAEENAASYTAEDWQRVDSEFKAFTEQYDPVRVLSLSDAKRNEVGQVVQRYARLRLEYAGRRLMDIAQEDDALPEATDGEADVEEFPAEVDSLVGEMEGVLEAYEGVIED
ncbi:MAG: hypothetical protein IJU19_04975 [Bacteroidales bacterium]|nr:hypothetical protein [Bacteroidales bacterium]